MACGQILITCLLFFCAVVHPGRTRSYEGYYVVVLSPSTENEIKLLQEIQGHYPNTISFWSDPVQVGRNVTISLDNSVFIEIAPQLNNAGISLAVVSENLQELIDSEVMENPAHLRSGLINLEQYNRYSNINQYLDNLAETCTFCSVINIGQSYEGRDLKVLKMSIGSSGKPGVFIEGGIHAREWISPATTLYIIDTMANRRNYRLTRNMLKYYDWYFLPLANPDGYEYTWTNDRLWRKTRSVNSGSDCVGTDPNRNWDFHWNEVGASDWPCSDIYAGPSPFSESETRAIAEFLSSGQVKFDLYLSFHSYGQYWLTPWGYTSNLPEDYDTLYDAADRAVSTITRHFGTEYTLGSSTNVLYAAAGASDDWAKGAANITFSYTVELKDSGWHGFLLPATEIIPQGREMWLALRTLVYQVAKTMLL